MDTSFKIAIAVYFIVFFFVFKFIFKRKLNKAIQVKDLRYAEGVRNQKVNTTDIEKGKVLIKSILYSLFISPAIMFFLIVIFESVTGIAVLKNEQKTIQSNDSSADTKSSNDSSVTVTLPQASTSNNEEENIMIRPDTIPGGNNDDTIRGF